MNILCEVSLGELVDKISILKIKEEKIADPEKVKNVKTELGVLQDKLAELNLDGIDKFLNELVGINSKLWKIEDDIRDLEAAKQFEAPFIELARAVYLTNDERFRVKNEINTSYGSHIKEVKSYKKYN